MTSDPDQTVRDAAIELADHIADFLQRKLQDRFIGFYLLGSLAHGGFSRRYSDIDLGLISESGISETDITDLRNEATARNPGLAAKLSLFWTDRTFSVGRFPPLDRVDYLDHAVALREAERVVPERPDMDEIRAYLIGQPLENWRTNSRKYSDLVDLPDDLHKPFLRAFLYAARFCYSWRTGLMGSNDVAVEYLKQNPVNGLDTGLIEIALEIRHNAADPVDLFPARKRLPEIVSACTALTLAEDRDLKLAPSNGSSNTLPSG